MCNGYYKAVDVMYTTNSHVSVIARARSNVDPNSHASQIVTRLLSSSTTTSTTTTAPRHHAAHKSPPPRPTTQATHKPRQMPNRQQPHAHVTSINNPACALHVARMLRHITHTTTNDPGHGKQSPPPNDSITARKEDNDRQRMASSQPALTTPAAQMTTTPQHLDNHATGKGRPAANERGG